MTTSLGASFDKIILRLLTNCYLLEHGQVNLGHIKKIKKASVQEYLGSNLLPLKKHLEALPLS